MRDIPDFFQLKTKKKRTELRKQIPTAERIVEKRFKQLRSNYPLRNIGTSTDGPVWIAEEERDQHLHIIGTTGEGKSRFIEHLIKEDIRRGNGVCLLDPTDAAETAYDILAFCDSIGFKKVCLIDPHTVHTHNKLSAIQPFHYQKSYRSASVKNIADTIRILFQTKDAADTPRIQRNLPALLNVLWNAKMTMHEALYFSEYRNSLPLRRVVLDHSQPLDRHRLVIEELFETFPRFNNEFSSTVRRLEPFFDSTLDLMFAATKGIDFAKMISEGWVILVNLYAGLGVDQIETRLLGTMVINEFIFAIDRLKNNGWKGVYYFYLDEAGRYANRNLADLLAYKRKSGLRVTLAHQYFDQFEDRYVLQAVKNLCKIKVMFNTPNHQDRLEMIKLLGYGGAISPQIAQYANADLPKQYAILKKGKEPPVRIQIPTVKSKKLKPDARKELIGKYLRNEWNYTPLEIEEQIRKRIYEATPIYSGASTKGTAPDGKATKRPIKRRPSVFDE